MFAWIRRLLPKAVVEGFLPYGSEPCPSCSGNYETHDWAMFATTVASKASKTSLEQFFKDIEARDWRSLCSFQDWKGTENNVEAYVVRCPKGGLVFVWKKPFELFEPDELYFRIVISVHEVAEIERHLKPASWKIARTDPASIV